MLNRIFLTHQGTEHSIFPPSSPSFQPQGFELEINNQSYPEISLRSTFLKEDSRGQPIEIGPEDNYALIWAFSNGEISFDSMPTKHYWNPTQSQPEKVQLWYAGIKEESDDDVERQSLEFIDSGISISIQVNTTPDGARPIFPPPVFTDNIPSVRIREVFPPKPGANAIFAVEVINPINGVLKVSIRLDIDSRLTHYQSASSIPLRINAPTDPNQSSYFIPEAYGNDDTAFLQQGPQSVKTYLLEYKVNMTPSRMPQDPVLINLSYKMDLDGTIFSGQEGNAFEVTNAWDPNKKTVSPQVNVQPNGLLKYTIHFQNIGTGPAQKVIVHDVLDGNDLDLSSLVLAGVYLDEEANKVAFVESGDFPPRGRSYFTFERTDENGNASSLGTHLEWGIATSNSDGICLAAGASGRIEYFIRASEQLSCEQEVSNTATIQFWDLMYNVGLDPITTSPATFIGHNCSSTSPCPEAKIPWWIWLIIGLLLLLLLGSVFLCWYFWGNNTEATNTTSAALSWIQTHMGSGNWQI